MMGRTDQGFEDDTHPVEAILASIRLTVRMSDASRVGDRNWLWVMVTPRSGRLLGYLLAKRSLDVKGAEELLSQLARAGMELPRKILLPTPKTDHILHVASDTQSISIARSTRHRPKASAIATNLLETVDYALESSSSGIPETIEALSARLDGYFEIWADFVERSAVAVFGSVPITLPVLADGKVCPVFYLAVLLGRHTGRSMCFGVSTTSFGAQDVSTMLDRLMERGQPVPSTIMFEVGPEFYAGLEKDKVPYRVLRTRSGIRHRTDPFLSQSVTFLTSCKRETPRTLGELTKKLEQYWEQA
jgi:hypothetical protein